MATEGRRETREEEIARIRSYLASQSAKRTPAQLIEALREAHRQFLQAAAALPEAAFFTSPQEGEWSASDVLNHVYRIASLEEQTICSVLERGERPSDVLDISTPSPDLTPEGMLIAISASRERLFASVLQADPQAYLDITWRGSDFGQLNWREWLLFARVHELDHARQLQAIVASLVSQEGE
ncbi:MAG TPA: DinB family protein [Ktedonobacteraceae bacterium]|nr:DinB family protein [Ktedonobacteraceae bacterium]